MTEKRVLTGTLKFLQTPEQQTPSGFHHLILHALEQGTLNNKNIALKVKAGDQGKLELEKEIPIQFEISLR